MFDRLDYDRLSNNTVQGLTIDQVAREEGIGSGTVSNIIKGCRQNDSEFDLMRQLAVKLKNQGDTIESFASTVRLRERITKALQFSSSLSSSLERTNMTTTKNGKEVESTMVVAYDDKVESLIESLEVFCFKRNLSIKEFADLVYHLAFTADNKFGVPFERLPDYVQSLESEADELIEQIAEKRLEMKNVLASYDATLEYNANRPLLEENRKLREVLKEVTRDRDMFQRYTMEMALTNSDEEEDTDDEL